MLEYCPNELYLLGRTRFDPRCALSIQRISHRKPRLGFHVRNPAGFRDRPIVLFDPCLNLFVGCIILFSLERMGKPLQRGLQFRLLWDQEYNACSSFSQFHLTWNYRNITSFNKALSKLLKPRVFRV